jgi:hypothetical protein
MAGQQPLACMAAWFSLKCIATQLGPLICKPLCYFCNGTLPEAVYILGMLGLSRSDTAAVTIKGRVETEIGVFPSLKTS